MNAIRQKIKFGIFVATFGIALKAAALVINNQPQSHLNELPGNNVTFQVVATGGPALHYQWRLNGVNFPNATNSTFFISNAQPFNAGNYSVVVSDLSGSINSSIARLTFNIFTAPPQDDFSNSFFLSASGVLRSDNFNATKEPGEPNHAGKPGEKSIWFSWSPQNFGIAKFRTTGSSFDSLLAVYTGNTVSNLVPVPSAINDDDRGGFLTSQIAFNAVPGQQYKIAVDGYAGAGGDVVLEWGLEETADLLPTVFVMPQDRTASPGQPLTLNYDSDFGQATWFFNGQPTPVTGKFYTINQANDTSVGTYEVHIQTQGGHKVITTPARVQINFRSDGISDPKAKTYDKLFGAVDSKSQTGFIKKSADASLASGFTSSQIFSTLLSNKDPGEPNHCNEPGGASEWYEVLASNSGTFQINTDGSSYNTVLAVYVGSGDSYATLTSVDCDNNVSPAGQDRVQFFAKSGVNYFIAIDGVGGARGSAHLNISLGDAPIITVPPTNQSVILKSNVTFTATATGSAPLTYRWQFNGMAINGATGSSYTVTNAQETNAGLYTVTVSNLINIVTSAPPASLSLLVPPSITTEPMSQTSNIGSNVTFTVAATGTPSPSFQWRWGGIPGNIPGATGASLTVTNVQTTNSGNYRVVITNSAGSATSIIAVLTINEPPAITTQPASQTITSNGTANLNVVATGAPSPAYQWQFNTVDLIGQTMSVLSVPNFQSANEGNYRVVITNSVGTITSSNALLLLNEPLRFTSFAIDTNTFSAQLVGIVGTNYFIQASTNLTDWTSLQTNTAVNGYINFTDTNEAGFSNRYFRGQQQP